MFSHGSAGVGLLVVYSIPKSFICSFQDRHDTFHVILTPKQRTTTLLYRQTPIRNPHADRAKFATFLYDPAKVNFATRLFFDENHPDRADFNLKLLFLCCNVCRFASFVPGIKIMYAKKE